MPTIFIDVATNTELPTPLYWHAQQRIDPALAPLESNEAKRRIIAAQPPHYVGHAIIRGNLWYVCGVYAVAPHTTRVYVQKTTMFTDVPEE